jgi:hypothetical protein
MSNKDGYNHEDHQESKPGQHNSINQEEVEDNYLPVIPLENIIGNQEIE